MRKGVVAEIARQLANWNVQTSKMAQLQYGFNVEHLPTIRTPNITFVPQNTVVWLTEEQHWTLQGPLFTATFVVKVADIGRDIHDPKFKADKMFKEELMHFSLA
ncbi:hypothetical protein RclHR1_11440004 [Rhizophagus clarus]|uniref:Uncharacterized protein n=1 Tax=Rhizophagus clarus TaxID=94130 RepID=A0A2Z6Q5Q6_9GLOM|nr:hypothetical protein RclHR1_11440004 [Rhizophagus clarus]GES92806.1 hypothetical protein GLOIN_2v1770913 [Rhizophagus clarus]